MRGKRSMTKVVRWTARPWSIASVGLILFFIVGEGAEIARPSEWLLFLCFPVGISAGMILAWWKEGMGGSIAVGSLLLFYVIHFASARRFPHGWAFLAFSLPGFLSLLCGHQARSVSKSAV